MRNSRANWKTSIFTSHHWLIIGICISGNSLWHIQMKITLSIYIEKIQNLCWHSSSKCVLPKTFRPHLNIPYRSEVIDETVTVGHFPTNFLCNYSSWITSHKCIFYPKFDFKIIDLAIYEKIFQAKVESEA